MELLTKTLKRINWKTYLLFFLVTLIPFAYTTFIRPLFYEHNNTAEHLSLMHNAKWMLFILVVAAETLFFPLISIFGQLIRKRQYVRIANDMKIVLLLACGAIVLINLLSIFVLPHYAHDHEALLYMHMEVLSLSMYILVQIPLIFFFIKERSHLLEFIFFQLVFFLVFDVFNYVTGSGNMALLPLGQALSYLCFFLIELYVLSKKYRIHIFSREKINWHFLRRFLPQANHALVDAAIIDMIVILFFEGIGLSFGLDDFYNFEMTVVLLPITALVIMVRAELSLEHSLGHLKKRVEQFAFIAGILSLIWTVGLVIVFLISGSHFYNILGLEEANFGLYLMVMFVFFNIRAVANIYKAAFHAMGELHYLSQVATRVAIFIFLPVYIISNEAQAPFSMIQIALISAGGILLESVLLIFYFYLMMIRKRRGYSSSHHIH